MLDMNNLIIIGLQHYLIISAVLFTIGIIGLTMKHKNIICLLMSIELMLLAININFVSFSAYLKEMSGQIFSIVILSIAAAEAAIGLAIILNFFRYKKSVQLLEITNIKG